MKKILALILSSIMLFTACGGGADVSVNGNWTVTNVNDEEQGIYKFSSDGEVRILDNERAETAKGTYTIHGKTLKITIDEKTTEYHIDFSDPEIYSFKLKEDGLTATKN